MIGQGVLWIGDYEICSRVSLSVRRHGRVGMATPAGNLAEVRAFNFLAIASTSWEGQKQGRNVVHAGGGHQLLPCWLFDGVAADLPKSTFKWAIGSRFLGGQCTGGRCSILL